MTINHKNAKFISADTIDCEIEHPTLGWIPFTLNKDDTSPGIDIAELFEAVSKDAIPYTPPTSKEILAETRDNLIKKIKYKRDFRTQNGGFFVDGKWFHSDASSRTQHSNLALLGSNIPPDISWKTMDGSFVDMTQELASKILSTSISSDNSTYKYAEGLIDDVNKSATPDLIDIESGWPKIYGE